MKPRMNILFSCDSGYAMPLMVCATSILENNTDRDIHIYILYSTLLEDQKQKLADLAHTYNQHIECIPVEEHYFQNVPALRWSKETYYRLLLNEKLPADLDRILYLDCDIIINKSIAGLYDMDMGENYLAMLIEKQNTGFRKRLRLAEEGSYFQAGVILFDVQKSRTILGYEKVIATLDDIGDRLIAVDQDVVNVMFDGKIKPINEIYNNCDITNFYGNNWNRFLNHTDPNKLATTCILHYSTGKPWNNLFSGACEKVWYAYLKKSPYTDLHRSKYGTLTYKLLRIGLFKILFYEYIHITPYINSYAAKIFPQETYAKFKRMYRKYIK